MTALITVLCVAGYLLGYFVYARFLARRIFVVDLSAPTPAHLLRDDVDYVPTLYLKQRGRNPLFTGIPMLFMLVSTLTAMVLNLRSFYMRWHEGGAPLFVVGLVLLLLAVWLLVEAVITLVRGPNN